MFKQTNEFKGLLLVAYMLSAFPAKQRSRADLEIKSERFLQTGCGIQPRIQTASIHAYKTKHSSSVQRHQKK